jgi:hypothetical protein
MAVMGFFFRRVFPERRFHQQPHFRSALLILLSGSCAFLWFVSLERIPSIREQNE